MGTTMSLEALLTGAIDYAGLFPPAELSMDVAVDAYSRYRMGSHHWMLGRFVVPASRLNELDTALASLGSNATWPVSATCSDVDDFELALEDSRGLLELSSLEVKLSQPDDVRALSDSRPDGVELFVEPRRFMSKSSAASWLDPLKAANTSLKIRTGGARPEQVPTSEQLAFVLSECASRRLPLKATAGLHHPIGNGSHGFLNVLLASVVALEGADPADVEEILDDDEPEAFIFRDTHAVWQQHVVRMESISASRELFFRSFGSCSFDEPVEGLEELGFLDSDSESS